MLFRPRTLHLALLCPLTLAPAIACSPAAQAPPGQTSSSAPPTGPVQTGPVGPSVPVNPVVMGADAGVPAAVPPKPADSGAGGSPGTSPAPAPSQPDASPTAPPAVADAGAFDTGAPRADGGTAPSGDTAAASAALAYPHPNALPGMYTSKTVATVALTGSFDVKDPVITTRGSGEFFHGNAGDRPDSFYFVYRPHRGDGEFIAKLVDAPCFEPENAAIAPRQSQSPLKGGAPDGLDSLLSPNAPSVDNGASVPDANNGIIFRENLDPLARFFYLGVEDIRGATARFREIAGSKSSIPSRGGEQVRLPIWLRIQRKGNLFYAGWSSDKLTWREVYRDGKPLTMPADVLVGFVSNSGFSDKQCTQTYQQAELRRLTP